MYEELCGRTAVVLGGTSGIGEDVARAFGAAGTNVVVSGRRIEAGTQIASEIRRSGGNAIFVEADITKEDDVSSLIGASLSQYGQLDFAVNSAGIIGPLKYVHELSSEEFVSVVNVNLHGFFLAMKHEVRAMLGDGGGCIVNIASVAAHVASVRTSPYTASKHGLVGLTKTAAVEYATSNIRINGVSPGSTDTPMVRNRMRDGGQTMEERGRSTPMQRVAMPQEMSNIILWLCSNRSTFITGHFISADGGFTLR